MVMLIGQVFKFSAAHKLSGNYGEPLHGHNYKLEITCKGKLNKEGKLQDTRTIKTIVQDIVLKKLHNSYLNDFFPQPTMENVVRWIWKELIDLQPVKLRLWENADSFVDYSEE